VTQPDEGPGLGLQGSQAVLQLLIPPHEVHGPHCDVQQAFALAQEQKPLTLLLLLQDFSPTPLLTLIGRRAVVPSPFMSIPGIIAVGVHTTAAATHILGGNVRFLIFFP
jgi:hypothetical protein